MSASIAYRLVLGLVATLGSTSAFAGTTIYVDDNALPPYLGTATNPFPTIQAGIDAAIAGDDVQVAAGTYSEAITMKSAVDVLGAGAGSTVIDGGGAVRPVRAIGVVEGTTLRGFTVRNGVASTGAGMYVLYHSKPTVADCVFEDNVATYHGGAIWVSNFSSVFIEDSDFNNNSAKFGGALYATYDSIFLVHRSSFTDNAADWGGAIYLGNHSLKAWWTRVYDSTIQNNTASERGGGIYMDKTRAIVERTVLRDNSGVGGGAANVKAGVLEARNLLMHHNGAFGCGAVLIEDSAQATLRNVTAADNYAWMAGGMCLFGASSATIVNSIFDNSSEELWSDGAGTYDVSYSDIVQPAIHPGVGNINGAPSLSTYYYQPSWSSPCLDAGSNSQAALLMIDLYGAPRIRDGDNDGTATVDMGAAESFFYVRIDPFR